MSYKHVRSQLTHIPSFKSYHALNIGYTLEILQEAQIYADHAQRPRDPSTSASGPTALEVDDLRMAVNSKLEHSYSSPLPKEFLLPLAAQINRVPLPILPESYGIRLPHERDRLTAVNWGLVPVTERRTYPKNDNDDQEDENGLAIASTSSQTQTIPNGTGTSGGNGDAGNMDLDLTVGDNLFGGNDDDDEDDDDDDEDMEEVVDPSLQPGRSQSKEHDDGEGEEDAEDDDGEEDGDEDEDEDDDDDDNGEEEDNDGEDNEYGA